LVDAGLVPSGNAASWAKTPPSINKHIKNRSAFFMIKLLKVIVCEAIASVCYSLATPVLRALQQ
jgi:hypothetical protein